jgi:glucosamine-6-phosphate deaminase
LLIDAALQEDKPLMVIATGEGKTLNEGFGIASKLTLESVPEMVTGLHEAIARKIERGLKIPDNQRILHTAPHHDDIELAYFPYLHHLVRSPVNENYFAYCTSGFTAVTNAYVLDCLKTASRHFNGNTIGSQVNLKTLHDWLYAQDDITGYLNGIAMQSPEVQEVHLSARLLRQLFRFQGTTKLEEVKTKLNELIDLVAGLTPGRKEPTVSHKLKGWLREFEAELVWAHFGLDMSRVRHLNLQFYSDDIFPRYPDHEQDVKPILDLMESIRPTIITLALDPEGSGPDTHYKTLIALAEAIDKYMELHPGQNLRVWGYRNVWSRFHLSDVNMVIPVSLNSFAVLHNMFNSCFISQKSASFPSFELDGTFSALAQKIWVEQHDQLVNLMGKEYFYDSPNPLLKRAFGAIFLKDMSYPEFKERMIPVRRLLKAKEALED